MCAKLGLLLLTQLLLPSASVAQARPEQISGTVKDEQGRPLSGVAVFLDSANTARSAETDSLGLFSLTGVRAGEHLVRSLKIGYVPFERRLTVPRDGSHLEITMARIQALDTIPVRAARSGVFGKVLSRQPFGSLIGAAVRVVGAGLDTLTEAGGDFNLPTVKPGTYMVMATMEGFKPRLISVVVPADGAIELALALDSASGAEGIKEGAMLMSEFDSRSRMRGTRSAIVARQEFAGRYGLSLGNALRYSISFARAGLVLDEKLTCIFVNGKPAPLASFDDFSAAEVVAVEIYGLRQDHTNTLMDRWPPGRPCGRGDVVAPQSSSRSGLQAKGVRSARIPIDNVVRAIVIWTNR